MGADKISALFLNKSEIMEDKEENKNKVPYKMARIAWPKAKYGLYLAIIIIMLFLIISYRHLIF